MAHKGHLDVSLDMFLDVVEMSGLTRLCNIDCNIEYGAFGQANVGGGAYFKEKGTGFSHSSASLRRYRSCLQSSVKRIRTF